MRRVTIRNGRNPFEFALVATCAVVGVVGLVVHPGSSSAVTRTFGPTGAQFFYLIMMVSSVIVLAGALWRRSNIRQLSVGMRVEQTGLLPLGGVCAAYEAAVFGLSGWSGVVAGGLIGGIALACWVRARIISADLRKLDQLIAMDRTRPQPPDADGDLP